MNSREIGLCQTKREGDRYVLERKMFRRQRVWRIRQSESSSLEQLTSFALDEDSGDAVLGTYGGLVSVMSTSTPPQEQSSTPSMRRFHEPQATVTRFTSQITSISLSPPSSSPTNERTGKALVCCSLGNENTSGTIHIGKFNHSSSSPSFENNQRQYGLEVYAVMKPRHQQSLFCTTVSKYTNDLFAVGGEKVTFVSGGLEEQQGERAPVLNVKGNGLAVEFLGKDTLAVGSRNGKVRYNP